MPHLDVQLLSKQTSHGCASRDAQPTSSLQEPPADAAGPMVTRYTLANTCCLPPHLLRVCDKQQAHEHYNKPPLPRQVLCYAAWRTCHQPPTPLPVQLPRTPWQPHGCGRPCAGAACEASGHSASGSLRPWPVVHTCRNVKHTEP